MINHTEEQLKQQQGKRGGTLSQGGVAPKTQPKRWSFLKSPSHSLYRTLIMKCRVRTMSRQFWIKLQFLPQLPCASMLIVHSVSV